jgi:8-oxo-dGTP diphosphatase
MPSSKRAKGKDQDSRVKRAYAGLGRATHKALTPFLQLYLRDKHVRVRALIINEDKEVLLVRSWFGSQRWSLPGGGIKQAETPAEAAVREVYEETGLRIAIEDLHELGVFKNPNPEAAYTVACYQVDIPKRPPRIAPHRRFEMLDAGWFPLDKLPDDRNPVIDLATALLK